MTPVPISKAREIAKQNGWQGVAIFYFGAEQMGVTSYGVSKAQCDDMRTWADSVFDKIGTDIEPPWEDHGCPWPTIRQD